MTQKHVLKCKIALLDHLGQFCCGIGAFEGKMEGAIGFSGAKSKVILEPIAKNKAAFIIIIYYYN